MGVRCRDFFADRGRRAGRRALCRAADAAAYTLRRLLRTTVVEARADARWPMVENEREAFAQRLRGRVEPVGRNWGLPRQEVRGQILSP